jgi:hypothetical protein
VHAVARSFGAQRDGEREFVHTRTTAVAGGDGE